MNQRIGRTERRSLVFRVLLLLLLLLLLLSPVGRRVGWLRDGVITPYVRFCARVMPVIVRQVREGLSNFSSSPMNSGL